MLKFASCKCFAVHIAYFLELERTFEAACAVELTADVENFSFIKLFAGKFLNRCFVIKNCLCLCRNLFYFSEFFFVVTLIHRTANLSSLKRQKKQTHKLCSVSLCRCDGNFRSCPCINYIVCFAAHGRTDAVCNRNYFCAGGFCKSHCSKCVSSFARLAHNNEYIILKENRIAVAVFRSDINNNGNASKFFECIFCNNTCVVCSSACSNNNAARVLPVITKFNFIEFNINNLILIILNKTR